MKNGVYIFITRPTRVDLRESGALDAIIESAAKGDIVQVNPDAALELIYAEAGRYATDEELVAQQVDPTEQKAARATAKKPRKPAGEDS